MACTSLLQCKIIIFFGNIQTIVLFFGFLRLPLPSKYTHRMKILTIFALEQEYFPLSFEGIETIKVTTGVGKTLAATSTVLAIGRHQPDAVLNIGTVGTYRHQVGDILVARRFVDRNMYGLSFEGVVKQIDMSQLSLAPGLPSIIGGKESLQPVTINTGDNFVLSADEDLGCDAVDMESFAMAWACLQTNTPFLSVKYVTDILGQNSVALWADKLAAARRDLEAYFCRFEKSVVY